MRRGDHKWTEAELAQVIVDHLEEDGWTTYKEVVCPSGVADIVAVQEEVIWIIETKTSFTAALCEQAFQRRDHAHYVSVCVPQRSIRAYSRHEGVSVLDWYLRQHGLGKIEVRESAYVDKSWCDELIRPKVNRVLKRIERVHWARQLTSLKESLHPRQRTQIAGSARYKYLTPYKLTIEAVREFLKQHGPATMKEIMTGIKHHYATDGSARSSLPKRLMKVEKGFKTKNEGGKILFYLSEESQCAQTE